jgi:type III pantothenate kinase
MILIHMTRIDTRATPRLIAADVGNARIKLGLFACGCAAGLPEPVQTLPLLGDEPDLDEIVPWLADDAQDRRTWWIASVNRPAATQLIDWLANHRPNDRITLLAAGDLPLTVRLERPDMVGVDRLVDAVAVNRLRDPRQAAVIVDVGSAITVDLVSCDGAFLGGAILPGVQMSARALHEFTDLLPMVDLSELTAPPPALGTATVPAIESGLFWGAVGAIRQLIERLGETATGTSWGGSSVDRSWGGSSTATPSDLTATPAGSAPQVFLTGGAAEGVAQFLGDDARFVPNLTLAGIALAAGVQL